MRATRNPHFVVLLLCLTLSLTLHAEETTKANPALWEISDEDTTVHLFGTLHLMRPGVDWLHGEVRSAFDEADELVLETVEPEAAQQILMEVAVNQTGPTLRSKLEPADRSRYENALQSIGMASNAFDDLKPWMASMTLSIVPMVQAGYLPEIGVDAVLEQVAKASSKTVTGLESYERHLGILDSLSEPMQLVMLNSAVQELDNVRFLVREMETLWSAGRIDEVGEIMVEDMTGFTGSQELYETLLTNRNKAWAEWIEQRMRTPGSVFLAVGAGHLAGKLNLRELLEAKGYTVTRVQTATALAD